MPLVRRTRATFRSAEFGFFGVWVNTRTQTPRFCGLSCSAGLLVLLMTFSRPFRTNWLIVGTGVPSNPSYKRRGTTSHGPAGRDRRTTAPIERDPVFLLGLAREFDSFGGILTDAPEASQA